MAFDFLGSPKDQEELDSFESFVKSEIDSIDSRILNITGNINRLTGKLFLLVTEAEKIGLEVPINKVVPESIRETRNERNHFDVDAAELVSSVKEPFIETIKEKREKLEFSIKRNYYAVSLELEKLTSLGKAKTEALATLDQARSAMLKGNLFGDTSSAQSDNQ